MISRIICDALAVVLQLLRFTKIHVDARTASHKYFR